MRICGLLKTTLLDYPGHVAATVFTGGCNFRCPFCHNGDLLDLSAIPPEQQYSTEEVLSFLKKRSRVLEGVCITGGEPTLQPDLAAFIRQVRDLGLLVKLDTNGSRPEVLKALLEEGLLDYVAMDIKTSSARYALVAGAPVDLEAIRRSVALLKEGSIPYEFRTTVVRELHTAADFAEIGPWLEGSPHYFLQNYRDSEQVLERRFNPAKKEDLEHYLQILRPFLPNVALRGVD